jgi:hypothetical protein
VIFEKAEMNEVNHLSLTNMDTLRLHLAATSGHKAYHLRIYESGKVLNGNINVSNILLDSGVTHASYISKELVDKHMDIWNGNITWTKGSVTLGDAKPIKPVYGVITLNRELHYEDQLTVTADVSLCVMDIGLPDIIEKYFFLFDESLQLCRKDYEDSRHQLTNNIVTDTCLPRIISLNDYPMDVERIESQDPQ